MPKMTPYMRPAMILRRKAMRSGVFGGNRFWKVVAYAMVGTRTFRRAFGRNPEVVEVAVLKGPGHLMQVETLKRPTRRDRRRAAR